MGSNGESIKHEVVVQMRIPAFGYSLAEFTIIELPQLGQFLSEGENSCIIESDKAIHEVAAPCSGSVLNLHAQVGQVLPVGSLLISIVKSEAKKLGPIVPSQNRVVSSGLLADNSNPILQITPMKNDRTQGDSEEFPEGYSIGQFTTQDMSEMLDLWIANQELALGRKVNINASEIRASFEKMILQAVPPFGCYIARNLSDATLSGWAACFPMENNPLCGDDFADVSVYVKSPTEKNTPAVLLLSEVVRHAKLNDFDFLVALTTESNFRASALLEAASFLQLGVFGRQKTKLWVLDL